MTGELVERATSDMLFGPDWAMNKEICEILNRHQWQTKDVLKDIKKRMSNKNPKVQLLALTLLETIVKNCGDIVHMHVAERDILHEMIKIFKKKHSDSYVKQKILILVDTWQENFGGPRARYHQYHAAYQELLRCGAVFPPRPKRSTPKFDPSKKQQVRSSFPSSGNYDHKKGVHECSVPAAMSLSEIQTARGIMDVLTEMLSAVDPGNHEDVKQELLIDLATQCRSYRQKVVHLVNSTSDEELLSQGLALNDDLQKVLENYDNVAQGKAVHLEEKKSPQALVDVDDSSDTWIDGSTRTSDQSQLQQLALPSTSGTVDPFMDLLSCNLDTTSTGNERALVPAGELPADSSFGQSSLVPADMFCPDSSSTNPVNSSDLNSAYTQQTSLPESNLQLVPSSEAPQSEQASHNQGVQQNQTITAWNCQLIPPSYQQHQALDYGANDQNGALPPPPWEVQPQFLQSVPLGGMPYQPMPGNQLGVMNHTEHLMGSQQLWIQPQFAADYSQMQNQQTAAGMFMQRTHQGGAAGAGQPHSHQFTGPGYEQQSPYFYSSPNELSQRMYGLSVQDNGTYPDMNSFYQMPTSSSYLQQPNKPSNPEDSLFGDLVSMARTKQSKN